MMDKLYENKNLPPLSVLNNGTAVVNEKTAKCRREELKRVLQEEEYGILPPKPSAWQVRLTSTEKPFCAGNAVCSHLTMTVTVNEKEYSFPFYSCIPKTDKKVPPIIFLNFRPEIYDMYFSPEEIMQRGYAVFGVCYKDVTSDDDDFTSNLASAFNIDRSLPNATGKIAIWAWSAMRLLDYAETLPEIEGNEAVVIGHSRLGKTALFAGAFDERFKYVISNDSGCGGVAIFREKQGENIEAITKVFPYWFCPRLAQYKNRENELPFDQHFLTALIAPRYLLIGSAEEDLWADPMAEYENAVAVGEAYRWYEKLGLVSDTDVIPKAPYRSSLDGNVFYQVRKGIHFLSHFDWYTYLDFIDSKRKNNLD